MVAMEKWELRLLRHLQTKLYRNHDNKAVTHIQQKCYVRYTITIQSTRQFDSARIIF